MTPAATPWLPTTCPPEQAMGEPPPESAIFLLTGPTGRYVLARRINYRLGGWSWISAQSGVFIQTDDATTYARIIPPQ